MTNEAKTDMVLNALSEAYNEHEQLAQRYLKALRELQESSKAEPWVIQDCEDTFHLHNCIAAVLSEIIHAGDDPTDYTDEPF